MDLSPEREPVQPVLHSSIWLYKAGLAEAESRGSRPGLPSLRRH